MPLVLEVSWLLSLPPQGRQQQVLDIFHSQTLSNSEYPFQGCSRDEALIDLFKIPQQGSCQLKQDHSLDVLTLKSLLFNTGTFKQDPLWLGAEER